MCNNTFHLNRIIEYGSSTYSTEHLSSCTLSHIQLLIKEDIPFRNIEQAKLHHASSLLIFEKKFIP